MAPEGSGARQCYQHRRAPDHTSTPTRLSAWLARILTARIRHVGLPSMLSGERVWCSDECWWRKQGRAPGQSARSRDAQTCPSHDRRQRDDGQMGCASARRYGVSAGRAGGIRCVAHQPRAWLGTADWFCNRPRTADRKRRSQRMLLRLSALLPLPVYLVQPAILGRRYVEVMRRDDDASYPRRRATGVAGPCVSCARLELSMQRIALLD